MIFLVCWFTNHLSICDNNNDDEGIADDSYDGDNAEGDRNNDWGQDWKDAEWRRVEAWPHTSISRNITQYPFFSFKMLKISIRIPRVEIWNLRLV